MSQKIILVFNCGSSSVKFALIEPESKNVIFSGLICRIDTPEANIQYQYLGEEKKMRSLPHIGYFEALDLVIKEVRSGNNNGLDGKIVAIGHRVVHGGEAFIQSTLITSDVLDVIKKCVCLAPLHNPANIVGIEAARKAFPELPQVAVFDTAFHQTIPEYAYIYPIPYEMYEQHQVRRYGFHGTSHRFVSREAALILGIKYEKSSFITAHLGNGCSASAIKNGKCLDTTMGLTPLEGLVMGTRSGDVDPGLHAYLIDNLGIDAHEVTKILNKKSGLLGISGISPDMRAILEERAVGNKRASLAFEIFCYRLAKYIGALAIPLGHIDALIFTGGIGENAAPVRARVIEWIKILGFALDDERNAIHGKNSNGIITKDDSVIAMTIATNEELLIALDTYQLSKIYLSQIGFHG